MPTKVGPRASSYDRAPRLATAQAADNGRAKTAVPAIRQAHRDAAFAATRHAVSDPGRGVSTCLVQ
jgi:hypothetical protein